MFDYHMHTVVSFDGHDRGLQMAQAAKAAGLKEICFTDHLDWDHSDNPNPYVLDVDNYLPKCRSLAQEQHVLAESRLTLARQQAQAEGRLTLAQEQHALADTAGGLTICAGIEIGVQPHLVERVKRLVAEHSFDFVIASTHLSGAHDLPWPQSHVPRHFQRLLRFKFSRHIGKLPKSRQ